MRTGIENFSNVICILRGYSADEIRLVLEVLRESTIRSVEITMNTEGALAIIREAAVKYGDSLSIGAGTVMSMEQLQAATEAGADFVLSPIMFTKEMLSYCRDRNVISVPGAFSPGEIWMQLAWGADIVKVFPAATVGSDYFRQLAGPFGRLPLMAVGGVNACNAAEFFENGCTYLGIGSGMFNRGDIVSKNITGIRQSVKSLEEAVGGYRERKGGERYGSVRFDF